MNEPLLEEAVRTFLASPAGQAALRAACTPDPRFNEASARAAVLAFLAQPTVKEVVQCMVPECDHCRKDWRCHQCGETAERWLQDLRALV